MCEFWFTTFPCGCFTWRSSGYRYCRDRASGCQIQLRQFMWKTFCPRSRKALKGRKCNSSILPKCTKRLGDEICEKLCRKCNSVPKDPSEGPTRWHCNGHLELVFEDSDADLADAEALFGEAVALWPASAGGHRSRYLRRKADKRVSGDWSL
ncbi:hypothetical protein F5Y10DRAFT_284180 [Nemania abortiva]|nr:hypothetical protein F5Y10DRAFT_284180 [Nemania abortiva]